MSDKMQKRIMELRATAAREIAAVSGRDERGVSRLLKSIELMSEKLAKVAIAKFFPPEPIPPLTWPPPAVDSSVILIEKRSENVSKRPLTTAIARELRIDTVEDLTRRLALHYRIEVLYLMDECARRQKVIEKNEERIRALTQEVQTARASL